ncbi:MAG: FtsX-like permease family protein, partial [Candidatus Hodarchaeales archaeon]
RLTDNKGFVNIENIHWGNYKIEVTYETLFQVRKLPITQNETEATIIIAVDILSYLKSRDFRWNSFREVKINNASEFMDDFFQTTFRVYLVTLTIGILITILLSLFSIISVITFPLFQHQKEIMILELIGATKTDIATSISLKLGMYGGMASIIGIIISEILLQLISSLNSTNIAGIIFYPIFDPINILIMIIIITIFIFVISWIEINRKEFIFSKKG